MCVVCASLRPWTPGCAYAAADDGLRTAERTTASAGRPTLNTAEIAEKLLTDYWNVEEPRSFDARAGDTLTYDVTGLTSAGRDLARAALAEWGTVTGLRFEEVTGGFRPDARRSEVGDAAASKATNATIGLNETFDGRLGSGDRDWIRLELPSAGTVKIVAEGLGGDALEHPSIAFFDAAGRAIPLGVQHTAERAEVVLGITGGGGTYYAQVRGIGGRTGDYRLSAQEPGATGVADITFDDARPGAFANTAFVGGEIVSADVNVSRGWLDENGDEVGTYGFQTYLHEIGHALGLGHPGDYGGDARYADDAEFANDSWQTTLMSYFDQDDNPNVDADDAYAITPMAADIAAARTLYGEGRVREGDTVYGKGSNAGGALDRILDAPEDVTFTIIDTGGRDRLDLSDERGAQSVDLRPGAVSDVLGVRGSLVLAEGTVIEDARTGSGDDTIRGNDARNDLRGGSGDDRLAGGDGDDTLSGGSGRDKLKGGSGDDVLDGGSDKDKLKGGGGDDVMDGGGGKDSLKGGGGADRFVFGEGFGRAKVKDFDGGEGDRLDLSRIDAVRSWADLRDDHLREKDDKVVLKAGEDGAVKLIGLTLDDLAADHFLF